MMILAAIIATLLWGNPSAAEKLVVGWLEEASVNPGNLILVAKVDTGAGNTSIDARNISVVERDGKRFLRFQVDDRKGHTVEIEREQVGIETVPRHNGGLDERPLVILQVCIGNDCRNTLVNLSDRSRLKYPLLIGRSFLLDRVVVNPSAQYIARPRQ
jgi:hypothetical protein